MPPIHSIPENKGISQTWTPLHKAVTVEVISKLDSDCTPCLFVSLEGEAGAFMAPTVGATHLSMLYLACPGQIRMQASALYRTA